VRIYDRGEVDDQLWISMDYVAGTDVAHLLDERYQGGMPADEVVSIVNAVASALDYAHHRGLLHRDVKPANILLTDPDGQGRRTFLADFGIARKIDDATRLTDNTFAVGTVAYAAPEQLRGDPVDGRADQYALACTAFHLLTGAPPYNHTNPTVVITQHISSPTPSIGARRPELARLDPVFDTAMAKNPGSRFSSCSDFALELSKHLAPHHHDTPVALHAQHTQPSISLPIQQPQQRWAPRSAALLGALIVVALLVVGGVFAGVKLTQPTKQATPASPRPTSPGRRTTHPARRAHPRVPSPAPTAPTSVQSPIWTATPFRMPVRRPVAMPCGRCAAAPGAWRQPHA
jgi:serine/threonine-protein kinase